MKSKFPWKIVVIAVVILTGVDLTAQKPIQNRDWSIVASYTISGKASGMAWDGQYLYYGIYGQYGDRVYRFDPATGQEQLLYSSPEIGDSFGMTYDGEFLWIIDQPSGSSNPALANKLSATGTILETFPLPDHYMSGIAWDNGNYWVCTYYPDPGKVYKVTPQGTILSQFVPPNNQPWDACLQDEFLWIADYYANSISKIDTATGSVIETHLCENQRPAGIVYDGQYLWYVDGALGAASTLYKVDLGGAGTPQISVPVTSWNYGNVAVGDSAVWDMSVGNSGTATLIIEGLIVPNAVPIFTWETFPITLEPGEFTGIEMIFRPTEPGPLNTNFQVLSTDPINPEVNVELTGEAVLVGPSIVVPITTHNFGNVRMHATTRWFFEVKNIGNEALVIESMTIDQPAFYLDESWNFPVQILPLETVLFGVWFFPPLTGPFNGNLTIYNNDPGNPAVNISLTGTGFYKSYLMGEELWNYTINTSWDNSPKAIRSISDISGDNVDDVIVCSEDYFVRCFNGNSHGTADILWEYEVPSGSVYQQQALAIHPDINGDGWQDVIIGTTGIGTVTAINGKTGQQFWSFSTAMWGNGGWVYMVDAARDFNNDGINDVLACAGNDGTGTGPRRAFCLNGVNGSLMWDNFFNGPGFSVISSNDVNGDGIPDAIGGASNTQETQGKVVGINGANGSTMWTQTTAGSSVWGLTILSDINSDGIPDVAAGDFMGNYYAYNPVNGAVLFSNSIGGSPIITRMFTLEDVNGDFYNDILFGSSSSNCVVVSGLDGSNIWLKPLADKAWNVAPINDIKGDAINDVIVGTLFSNNLVYFLDGTSGEEFKSVSYGEAIDAITTIPDINEDGSMEVVAGGRYGKLVCYAGGSEAAISVSENQQNIAPLSFSASPNPFSANVSIHIEANIATALDVCIITAGGLQVKDLGKISIEPGIHEINWDGRNESGFVMKSGLYFAIITNGRYSSAVKLIKQ